MCCPVLSPAQVTVAPLPHCNCLGPHLSCYKGGKLNVLCVVDTGAGHCHGDSVRPARGGGPILHASLLGLPRCSFALTLSHQAALAVASIQQSKTSDQIRSRVVVLISSSSSSSTRTAAAATAVVPAGQPTEVLSRTICQPTCNKYTVWACCAACLRSGFRFMLRCVHVLSYD